MKASIILSTYNRPQALLMTAARKILNKSLRISSNSQPFQYCMPGKMTEDFVLHLLATMPSG